MSEKVPEPVTRPALFTVSKFELADKADHTLKISTETVGQVLAEEPDKLRAEFKTSSSARCRRCATNFCKIGSTRREARKLSAVQSAPASLIA